jgi:spectinomycin phosphotransferase
MLEDPHIPESLMISRLQVEYGLDPIHVSFLPLGYDLRTAVYRVETPTGKSYFLKLHTGKFTPIGVTLPQYLCRQGIPGIIEPLITRTGKLFGQLDQHAMILYPFIDGEDGYQVELSDQQWVALGKILKRVHAVQLPEELRRQIQVEWYNPHWRESAIRFLDQVEQEKFGDPISANLAAFMLSQRKTIRYVVSRAGELAELLKQQPIDYVLCHNDPHPGNYLVADNGELYLVDWDDPILAPRERDLIFFDEETSGIRPKGLGVNRFYEGYGQVKINFTALAYFRFERIIVDMAEFCQQILLIRTGDEDRQQAYIYFTDSFLPGHDVERALKTDQQAGGIS